MKNPPILTGKINEFIWYGSEPKIEKNSFNKKRSQSIEKAIDNENKKWIMKNQEFKDIEIGVRNGKTISFTSSLLEITIRELSIQIANHAQALFLELDKRLLMIQ